jgi:hypothetical protein
LRLFLIVGCLIAGLVSATTTHAQVANSDFPGQLQPTLPANQDLVAQIDQTEPAIDLATIMDQTQSTLNVGTDLEQQLTQLLTIAPDNAARSRIEGVLTHVQASVDSLRMVHTETTLDSARARLDQARGEAQEALTELRPFVVGLPATMPIAGK